VRLFLKNVTSLLISLILAILVWVAAVREQNPPREGDYNQAIPIEVIQPADSLIITSALPETLRLRLLGPQSSWATLTPSKIKASVDLSGLSSGLHDVPVKVTISDAQVEIIEQNPRIIGVNLEAVQTVTMPIQVDLLGSPALGYTTKTPQVEPSAIAITGPASLINRVNKTVVEIFLRNSKETLQNSHEVLIRDQNDQSLKDLQAKPAQVQVTVPIEQRFGYKDVSVRARVQGQVARGYRVSNILVEPPTITVVGNPRGLAQIEGFVETAPINLNQATENIVRVIPLNLPNGVTTVSAEQQEKNGPGGVQVTVEVTPIEDAITLPRPISQQGIDPDYWWRASPSQAEVFLSGPLSQIQNLRASDIEVIVDLFGLEPGVYKLQPTVFRPDALRVDTILPDTVEITIGKMVPVLITVQELDANYTWKASPSSINVLLAGSPDWLRNVRTGEIRAIVDLA
jgi:YbbR domain-containing protein